ncbi:hypothetical protein DQ04_03911020 [Trypanosoma grayi]|uniref:hypothetical protein n=1 Tax=Trypanosoma grayi TaxID=71804 RepID=UPI0004F4703B|nr:hypothetical protein DQ04_03911020 [Trypanosoma grayi]KEG10303.1 hypothetical protein DQ04_03911020 [Trypanosoma grayi]
MYTFRRPQQQQQQLSGNDDVEQQGMPASEGGVDTYTAPDNSVALEEGNYAPTQTADAASLQQQQAGGQFSEEASAEEVLQYCRNKILCSRITVPPQWRRVRTVLPASIAELHLTPSAPEPIQQASSPCVVLLLDSGVPEGMTVAEYSKSLVKYVIDLLAYQGASTAITSLRFVKLGTELSQLVVTFGRDVRLATRVLEEFTKVGLRAGFGAPLEAAAATTACATFRVTDYYMTLHGGTGITAEEVASLLQPERPPLGVNVVPGYEPGVFYVAVEGAEVVHAWLWNPFCSFLVQHTLFERLGVLLTMADCPHEFVSRGVGRHQQQQEQQQGRRQGRERQSRGGNYSEDGDNSVSGGDVDDNDDGGNMEEDGSDVEKSGGRAVESNAMAWASNAKEEIDIFEGLDKETEPQKASLELVDDGIIEVLHNANTEKQQQKQQQQQQQQVQQVYAGGAPLGVRFDQLQPGAVPPALSMPYVQPFAIQQQQQQQQLILSQPPYYGKDVPQVGGWQAPPPIRGPQIGIRAPPLYGMAMTEMHASEKRSDIKYPELVDDNSSSTLPERGNEGEITSTSAMAQQQQYSQSMYWNLGGGQVIGDCGSAGGSFYPAAPSLPLYGAPPYMPLPQMQQQQHLGMNVNAAPSILGQPVYSGAPFHPSFGDGSGRSLGVLAPPITMSVPLPSPKITEEQANEWADKLEELLQIAFPAEGDGGEGGATGTTTAAATESTDASSSDALFHHVPCSATVPFLSPELEDTMAFVREQLSGLKAVIASDDDALTGSRRRIIAALLTRLRGVRQSEAHDWVPLVLQESSSNGDGTQTQHVQLLPALLPYLLLTSEGIELASELVTHASEEFLPLLARYILPFLLDTGVVQSVGAAALRAEVSAANPLVQRILRHWGALAAWLHAHIQYKAVAADGAAEHTAAVANSSVAWRLTSQASNVMDILLTAMSREQQEAVRTHLEATGALSEFARTVKAVEQQETLDEEQQQKQQRQFSAICASTPSLWYADGAIHRSLLRLYLNANLFSGTEFVELLFAPQPCLTRSHYGFVTAVFSKSQVSPVLSNETARVCGGFIRLMEQKILSVDSDSGRPSVLHEKDAMHLVEMALRELGSVEAYTCLRDAYFAAPSPVKRYKTVEEKLSQETPPAKFQNQQHQQQQQHFPTAILGASSSYHTYKKQQQQQGTDGRHSDSSSGWQAEWTAAMRNYPQFGEPFTPLPTGWTSALSRSYGHYYFKNPKGSATYKHPTDATEFMVAPQAFLREPGVTVTLAEVLTHANSQYGTGATAGDAPHETSAAITEERAERWLKDQRMRVEALDLATLALLKVTYRVGGGAGRRGLQCPSAGGGSGKSNRRHRRSSSSRSGGRHHHRHSHKRTRSRSPSPAQLQRRLTKLHEYRARGHPFPPLPRGWTCNLSTSNGLYYFRPPHGSPVYRHPHTRREYRASPQAFVLHRDINANAIAVETHRSIEDVEKWLADQRQRDEELDGAVARMLAIEYAPCLDYSDDEGEKNEDKGGDAVEVQQEGGGSRSSSRSSGTPRRSHAND